MDIRYSGQYAAAQLGKLPLPHSLQLDIAEYINHHDLDLLLPPTCRTFARMLGRLPADKYTDNDEVRVRAFEYELHNYRGLVNARRMARYGKRVLSDFLYAPLAGIREMNGNHLMLFDIYIRVTHTRDDFEFFRMWREQYNYEWPRTPRTNGPTVHDRLWRPVCKYASFEVRHKEHAESVHTIMCRHNSALTVFRSFNNADGSPDSDSADDEP